MQISRASKHERVCIEIGPITVENWELMRSAQIKRFSIRAGDDTARYTTLRFNARIATHGRRRYRFIGAKQRSGCTKKSLFPKFDLLAPRVFIRARPGIVILNLGLIPDRYRQEL